MTEAEGFRMTAPLLKRYVDRINEPNGFYLEDEEDIELFKKIESIVRELPPNGDDCDSRRLWISIPRGPIEDFGEFDEEEWDTYDDFVDFWKCYHPDEADWYVFYYEKPPNGSSFIVLGELILFMTEGGHNPYRKRSYYHTDLLKWLVGAIRVQVDNIKSGTYHDLVVKELPIGYRKGVVKRSDIWDSGYWTKENDLDGTTEKDIEEFANLVDEGIDGPPKTRLGSMTLNDYLSLCSLCFKTRGNDIAGMTLKEQYSRFADGRDDGMLELDPDDPDAFKEFVRTSHSGHIWEIRSGHGWSMMHLFPRNDEKGWYTVLNGSFDRTDFVHIALSLFAQGIPLTVNDAKKVLKALRGEDYIGIVPRDDWPFYAQYRFKEYDVLECITFRDDLYAKLKNNILWYEVDTFYPISES